MSCADNFRGLYSLFFGRQKYRIEGRTVEVLKKLGEGGYSHVFHVRDKVTGEEFALKKVMAMSDDQIKAADAEIKALRLFRHENIIRAVAVGEEKLPMNGMTGKVILFLFPYVSGGTLQDRLDDTRAGREPMTAVEILLLFHQVCRGVQSMHTHDPPYAHRDLKPGNVLLDEFSADGERAVLMDMGSTQQARATPTTRNKALEIQEHAEAHSTAPYRAPELFDVATDVPVTESTDIWSLGCILYAMMYLESPFDQDYISGGSLLLSMMSGKIRFPSQDKAKAYPESMHELVKKILVLDRTSRPSVEQVLDMVEEELRIHKPR